MWAVGRYDLGLTESDFWALTLKEFDALCKRKQLNDRRIESHSATISCLLYNINRGENKALTVDDFMSKKAATKQSDDDMKRVVRSITAASKGTIQ